jgi:hypothetical protein
MRMPVMGSDDDAEATKCTGDPVADAGSGEVTVTPAHDVAARKIIAITYRIEVCSKYKTEFPLRKLQRFFFSDFPDRCGK